MEQGTSRKSIPVAPGGFGIYEGIVALVLSWLGYPIEIAIVLGILDHLLKKLYNLAIGWPAAFSLGMGIRDIFKMLSKIRKDT